MTTTVHAPSKNMSLFLILAGVAEADVEVAGEDDDGNRLAEHEDGVEPDDAVTERE